MLVDDAMGRRSTGTAALLSPAVDAPRSSRAPSRRPPSRSEAELDAFLAAPVAAPTVLLKRPSRPPPRQVAKAAPQPSESTLTVDIGEVELIDPAAAEAPSTRGKLGWKIGALTAVLALCAFGYVRVERPELLSAVSSTPAVQAPAVQAPAIASVVAPPAASAPIVAAAPAVPAASAQPVAQQVVAPEVTRGAGAHHPARAPHRAKPAHKAAPSVAAAAPAPAPVAAAPAPAPAKPKGPVSADVHQSQRASAQANQIIGNSL